MSNPSVAIVDYGMGNLLSVCRGLEHCGAIVTLTSDPDVIFSASRIILPGVGAFSHAMEELRRLELDEVVKEVAVKGTPLMGICLGMQLLCDESDEFGKTAGLGLIPGTVIRLPTEISNPQKVPYVGWSELTLPQKNKTWQGTVLQDLKPGDALYFVHSFMVRLKNTDDLLADYIYGENPVSAVISRDNIVGCQFHPEKSGKVGLKVLNRFLSL